MPFVPCGSIGWISKTDLNHSWRHTLKKKNYKTLNVDFYKNLVLGGLTLQRKPMSLNNWSFSSSERIDDGLFSGWGRLAAVMAMLLLVLDF
jgi:hypothetical protein